MEMQTAPLVELLGKENTDLSTGIASTFQKIKSTRTVSQTDVEPFINYFPMTVSLSNFSEEPSEKGLDMALEGFAVLFKVAASIALVGALGICIYNFIRSRQAAETTTDFATKSVNMSAETFKLMDQIRQSPGYQSRTTPLIKASEIPVSPNGRGMHLTGEVNFNDWAEKFYGEGHTQHFTNAIASKIAAGTFDSVTANLMQTMSDYLSDLAGRVKKFRELTKGMPARINAGELDKLVIDINNVDTRTPRSTVLKVLNQVYDKVLPPPRQNFMSDSAQLLEDRVTALKNHFDSAKDDKNFVKEAYLENVTKWRAGDVEGMMGQIPEICKTASKLGAAPSLSTGKNVVNECEELKKELAKMEIPEVVDTALRAALESIRLDSVSAVALFDMVINEQRQFTIYSQDILNMTVELALAVSAFTRPTDPSKAKRLASDAVNAAKLSKKIKV